MKFQQVPKVVLDEILAKRILYGEHCNGCKYFFAEVTDWPCRMCELICKPSHYVKAEKRR